VDYSLSDDLRTRSVNRIEIAWSLLPGIAVRHERATVVRLMLELADKVRIGAIAVGVNRQE
jgi:EAL domain-containing protein (putative c-di-GMP-specific phosphodiesterase class I)